MENQFAAIDISFIGTQGSYNYSKFFIEFIVNEICPFNCVFLCINSNSNSYAKMLSNKFGFKTVVFDSIFSYLSHLYFLRKSISQRMNHTKYGLALCIFTLLLRGTCVLHFEFYSIFQE